MSDIPDVYSTWKVAKRPMATGGRDLIACDMFVPSDGPDETEICGYHLAVTFDNPLDLIAKIAEHARSVRHAHVELPVDPPPFAPAPDPGPGGRFVSRQTYANGTRQAAWAVQVTENNYQRIIGWLDGHVSCTDWSTDPDRLNFGGRRGSYSIPVGWWVVLFTPADHVARPGVEGWDPDEFASYWIEKSEQDRADLALATAISAAGRRRH